MNHEVKGCERFGATCAVGVRKQKIGTEIHQAADRIGFMSENRIVKKLCRHVTHGLLTQRSSGGPKCFFSLVLGQ